MIIRRQYIQRITPFIGKPFVKIISGIRRCGKSTLLMMIKEELINRGVSPSQVVYMNFESFEWAEIDSAKKLYSHIKSTIKDSEKKYYILLDEIQEIRQWEKAVNSFMVDLNVDIYITGSNSRLLSSELATYLTGRYVEIDMYPLSFSEVIEFQETQSPRSMVDRKSAFQNYLRLGGFPSLHTASYSTEDAYKIVYDIYSSVILRDTIQRHNIRNLELLERVVKYVFDNVGNIFSAKKVADYFKSQQRKIDINTVYNYLDALEGAFIIYRTPRFDIKGKEILKTNEKYFVGDQALIYGVLGYKDRMISGILENIVMLELKRRGYNVFVGKLGDREVDFIAEKKGERIYIQVVYKLSDEKVIEREFSVFSGIRDHYPKYVVSMEDTWSESIEGVLHKHISDFLLMKSY